MNVSRVVKGLLYVCILGLGLGLSPQSIAKSPSVLGEEVLETRPDFKVQQNEFIEFTSKDIVCESCVETVKAGLMKTGIVLSFTPDVEQNKFHVVLRPHQTLSDEDLNKIVMDLGYSIETIKRGKI